MSTMNTLDFRNKKVLLRADLNVPLNKGVVGDDTRIEEAMPTIKYILSQGGSVVLISHLGRPKGERKAEFSLKQIVKTVEDYLGQTVGFIDDCIGKKVEEAIRNLSLGEVLLLENLRFCKGETEGDEQFAKQLFNQMDIYINDAYGTSHRKHASTYTIPKFLPKERKASGLLLEKEIKSVNAILRDKKSPVVAIIGGAKVSSKINVLESLLKATDKIIIGGAMIYTFIKAKHGSIGKSLFEEDYIRTALRFLEKASQKGVEVYLPEDTIATQTIKTGAKTLMCKTHEIPTDYIGVDIGPNALEQCIQIIESSRTLLWNGPMGIFEIDDFSTGTVNVAKSVAKLTEKGGFTMVGGGDSVAAIKKFKLQDSISHLSTGGGAMLEHIEHGTLPAIEALK